MSTLDLETARRIIAATLDAGHEQGLKPLSVAVLDAGGHLVAFEREDGSSTHRFQVAHGKAHGAIAMGVGTRGLDQLAQARPYFMTAVGAAIGGAMVPVPGGVLVCDEAGTVLGAVGVSGDVSDNDETAVIAGVEAVGLVARAD
ncbi:MAG TPA: heme-binding protein [Euzebyales bacterium]|nr:heme-binding protein [Euzebyales bacterium]